MFKPHRNGHCTHPDCVHPDGATIVISKGWCDRCNFRVKQEKKKAAGKKTGPYKYKKVATGEKTVFEAVLDNLPDTITRCFVCGVRVAVVTHNNFGHVLAKGKYPLFRLKPENVVILCHRFVADANGLQGCHFSYDHTPHSTLKGEGWEKLFALREKLIEEYNKLVINSHNI